MITLDNPQLEQQIQALFGDDQQAFQAWLVNQIKQVRLKKELHQAIQEAEKGQLISMDEAFARALAGLGAQDGEH